MWENYMHYSFKVPAWQSTVDSTRLTTINSANNLGPVLLNSKSSCVADIKSRKGKAKLHFTQNILRTKTFIECQKESRQM